MSLISEGPSSIGILCYERSAFSQRKSYSLSQRTFYSFWKLEAQMLIPDKLGDAERNESWLLPLETPIPTPFLFPLIQNCSKFSLKETGRDTSLLLSTPLATS